MPPIDLNPGSTVKVARHDLHRRPTTRPNHHAHHRGFSGLSGVLAALSMTLGRGRRRPARRRAHRRSRRATACVDLGCGPGAAVAVAARRGAPVIGVDPAPVMLDVARRLTRSTATSPTWRARPRPSRSPTPPRRSCGRWPPSTTGPTSSRRSPRCARVLAPGGRFLAAERRTHARRHRARQPRLDRRPGRGVRGAVPRGRVRRRHRRDPRREAVRS